MRISLINLNLVAEDAVGSCIVNQARLFCRRGDDLRVYTEHPPERVPADVEALTRVVKLADLEQGRCEHFRLSDLYVYHYPGHYELIESIRSRDRGTVIFYYHNVTPPELWGTGVGRSDLERDIESTALVHYADVCVTPSPFNKDVLVDRFQYAADRVHVVPLAVPLDRFFPSDKPQELLERYHLEGQRVLLFVGRMAGNKRIDLLIEALAQVKKRVPTVKLLLVGDHQTNPAFRPVVAEARRLARSLGVAEDVIWTGRVPHLPPYLRLADVYVTASLHEGFGQPLIEAMACGTPVVASEAGAMPWVVDEAGLLFEPGDADDLSSKLIAVLEDDELYQNLVERGLRRSTDFGLENYEIALTKIVDAAVTYTMPAIPYEESIDPDARRDVHTEEDSAGTAQSNGEPNGLVQASLKGIFEDLEALGDVAKRGYVVRSEVPILGPLIAWVRRNLTSHLREPYLDPMIERQVAFNHRVTEAVRYAMDALMASTRRQDELVTRIEELEGRIGELSARLSDEEVSE